MENSKYLGKVDSSQKHIFEMGKTKTFGDIDIESFGVSHDAVAPQFYRFMKDDKSFVMLTDTGYVSDRMAGIVENADGYLIESNHDVESCELDLTHGDSNNGFCPILAISQMRMEQMP